MSLVNDYFLLYHGITFEQNLDVEEIEATIDEDTFTIFALIVSATRKNFDKYLPLTSFKTLCQQLNVKSPSSNNELNHLQHNIVQAILSNKSKQNISILHSSFEYLKSENIINNENYNKLISLFDYKELDLIEESNNLTNNITNLARDACMYGNAYREIASDRDGTPLLTTLPPGEIDYIRDTSDKIY